MRRQRNRNRRSGGQGGQNNNPNRSLDSTGPEGIKVRGNAQTVYERYQQLARDATSSGDRILAENYLQHAEHYFRLLRIIQPNRPVSEISAREGGGQGFDIDFEDESGTQFANIPQNQTEGRDDNANAQSQDGGGDRDNRNDRDNRTESESGDERRTDNDDRSSRRGSRRDSSDRRRNRKYEDRDDAPRGDRDSKSDPLAVIETASDGDNGENHMPSFLTRPTSAVSADGEDAPAPARKPRTRRPRPTESSDSED